MGILLFGLFATATFLTLLTGQESTRTGSARVRGVYYTEQALEVAKSIRDNDFDDLTAGTHGYTIDDNGVWVLSGSNLSRYNYDTELIITSLTDTQVRLVARSKWKHGYNRSGATLLSMELIDWRNRASEIGDWSNPTETGSITFTGIPLMNDVLVEGDYAYITSSAAGAGLYIVNVGNPTSPSRVSSTFSLSGEAHKMAVYQNRLYLVVEDGGDEMKCFDVTDPTGLSASTVPLESYNIPGDTNRALALARKGDVLFIGAKGDGSESELYSFDISNSGSISLLDELNIDGDPTIYDIYVSGNYAYLATDKNTQELITIDVSDTSDMYAYDSMNAYDVHDGYAVRAMGTGHYLGRFGGGSIDEYILNVGSGGHPGVNSYTADIGDTVNAMDIDAVGCYAFLATDFFPKELQIRSARYTNVQEETYVDMPNDARGVYYNLLNDLLYVSTSSGMHIFESGPGTPCL